MPAISKRARVKGSDDENQKKLIEAYDEFLKKLLEQKKIAIADMSKFQAEAHQKDPVLQFDSKESADTFFKEQAQAKTSFAAIYEDGKGKPTGEYCISTGDGELHQGKFKPETMQDLKKSWATIQSNPTLGAQVKEALKSKNEGNLEVILAGLKSPAAQRAVGLLPLPDQTAPKGPAAGSGSPGSASEPTAASSAASPPLTAPAAASGAASPTLTAPADATDDDADDEGAAPRHSK